MAETKSLIAKLAEACNAVGGVEKKGRNDFHRYNYVKAADIAKAIRHELFERGIIVVIDEKSWAPLRQITLNSGSQTPEMLLTAEVTFRDATEVLGPFTAMATAMDSGDKGIYKAKTGLLKYVLRGIGLIPDERDDPEFDESVDEQTDPRVLEPGTKASRKKAARVLEYQARAWDSAVRESGKTAEQVAKYLRVRWSAANVTELTQDDFTEAIRWALGAEDLKKTLSNSLEAARSKPPQPVTRELDRRMPDEVTGD